MYLFCLFIYLFIFLLIYFVYLFIYLFPNIYKKSFATFIQFIRKNKFIFFLVER